MAMLTASSVFSCVIMEAAKPVDFNVLQIFQFFQQKKKKTTYLPTLILKDMLPEMQFFFVRLFDLFMVLVNYINMFH